MVKHFRIIYLKFTVTSRQGTAVDLSKFPGSLLPVFLKNFENTGLWLQVFDGKPLAMLLNLILRNRLSHYRTVFLGNLLLSLRYRVKFLMLT